MNPFTTRYTTRRDDEDTVTILADYKGQTVRIAHVYNDQTDENDLRLIQYAPYLYMALQALLYVVDGLVPDKSPTIKDALNIARDVLSKIDNTEEK